MKKRIKVAITGAAGQIGYAFLFRLASGQVFGCEVELDLNLLEVTPALQSLKGVAMELEDCAFPLLRTVTCTDDLTIAMKDINYAVLLGSMPRKAGMERSDLLEINGKIFTTQGKAINDYASSDVKVFVVGNPCNTNCLIAMHSAPDLPNDRFFAMTLLDENRAKMQLAIKACQPVKLVKNMIVWGNHSATQYPDFYNAKIGNQSVLEVINDENWLKNDFIPSVQKRGALVIETRGASSAASAANGIVDSLTSLVTETANDDIFSMCLCSNGEYGIDPGLIFSFPCRTKNGKVEVVEGFKHNAFGQEKIQITLNELKKEYEMVKALGLVK